MLTDFCASIARAYLGCESVFDKAPPVRSAL